MKEQRAPSRWIASVLVIVGGLSGIVVSFLLASLLVGGLLLAACTSESSLETPAPDRGPPITTTTASVETTTSTTSPPQTPSSGHHPDTTKASVTSSTTSVSLPKQTASSTATTSSPVVDELSALAGTAQIPVYYLGPSYGGAPLIEVSGRKDGYAVSLVYRNTDPEELLSINLAEYDPVYVPELKKPFDWWTLVSEVEMGPYEDAIYLSQSGYLFYVARRDTVEINIAGYSAESEGPLTEVQLKAIAQSLVPFGQ